MAQVRFICFHFVISCLLLSSLLSIIRALPCTTMPRVPCGGDALAPVMLEEYERKLSEWLKEEDERESQMLEETREALLHAMHLIQPVRDFEVHLPPDVSFFSAILYDEFEAIIGLRLSR